MKRRQRIFAAIVFVLSGAGLGALAPLLESSEPPFVPPAEDDPDRGREEEHQPREPADTIMVRDLIRTGHR